MLKRSMMALLVLLAACARTVPGPGATPTPGSSPPPNSGGACAPATGGDGTFAFLEDVRVGTHDGFDRITFQFEPATDAPLGLPDYELDSATPPFADTSEKEIPVEGNIHAAITFHGGTGVDLSGEEFRQTYAGPNKITPRFEVLTETARIDDFEATLTWAMGLDRTSCWQVSELSGPPRLVIDFPH